MRHPQLAISDHTLHKKPNDVHSYKQFPNCMVSKSSGKNDAAAIVYYLLRPSKVGIFG